MLWVPLCVFVCVCVKRRRRPASCESLEFASSTFSFVYCSGWVWPRRSVAAAAAWQAPPFWLLALTLWCSWTSAKKSTKKQHVMRAANQISQMSHIKQCWHLHFLFLRHITRPIRLWKTTCGCSLSVISSTCRCCHSTSFKLWIHLTIDRWEGFIFHTSAHSTWSWTQQPVWDEYRISLL